MLTPNVNQFIPQDYYASLPTTLDAKKSPLALLAQTCSQIGNDSLNSKSILSPSDKVAKRDKSSPSSSSNGSSPNITKSSFKPYESCLKDIDKCNERKSAQTKTTPTSQDGSQTKIRSPSASPNSAGRTSVPDSQPCTPNNPSTSSPVSTKSADAISSLKSLSAPASSAHNFIPNYSVPLDVMASSLLSSHSLKAANANPYLNYGRLKGSGVDGVVPVCRDPYCTTCQLGSHLLAASAQNGKPCPPGCTQCDMVKSSSLLSGAHGSTTLAAAYAQAQLAALAAASQMPYMCSWMGTDTPYCGKRFLTSEDLLQHLRTHTSESMGGISAHSLMNRTYPTPPLSPLSTARYHPYTKPQFIPPSLFPLQTNPAFHPAFSPYLFYNSKLGSTSHH